MNKNKSDHKSRQYTRRNALSAGGVLGLTALTGIPVVNGESMVELPKVVRGDEVIETFRVPRSWHDHTNQADRIRSELREKYNQYEWFSYIGQGADDNRMFGELSAHQITVYTESAEGQDSNIPKEAIDLIPDEVDGVNISIDEAKKRTPDNHYEDEPTCTEENDSYDCVPGGSKFATCHSTGCIADDDHIIASAHGFFDSCDEDIEGDSAYSGSYSNKIGEIVDYDRKLDVSKIDSSGEVDGINNSIANDSNVDVVGAATENFVDSLISNYDSVFQMGSTTGRTSGYLDEKVSRETRPCREEAVTQLSLTPEAAGGDSGGPHYHVNDYDNAAILAIHNSHSHYSGNHYRSFGAAGYEIQDKTGWTIGSANSSC
jgi:hypothetical protein